MRYKLSITNKNRFMNLKNAALELKLKKVTNPLYYSDEEFRIQVHTILDLYNQEMTKSCLLDVSCQFNIMNGAN